MIDEMKFALSAMEIAIAVLLAMVTAGAIFVAAFHLWSWLDVTLPPHTIFQ